MNNMHNMMGRLLHNYNYLYIIGVLLLLVMIWVILHPSRTSVDLSVFVQNVQPGMTATELKAKLGPPLSPSNLPREITIVHKSPSSIYHLSASYILYWYDGKNLLEVYFNDKMKVTGRELFSKLD